MTFLRRTAVQGASIAQRRLLVSLEINSKDPSYHWFLQWMSAQAARQSQLAETPLRGMTMEGLASRIRSHELAVETKYEQRKDGSSSAQFSLVPGPGTHYFRYESAWFQVSRVLSWSFGRLKLTTSFLFEWRRSNEKGQRICSIYNPESLGRQSR